MKVHSKPYFPEPFESYQPDTQLSQILECTFPNREGHSFT